MTSAVYTGWWIVCRRKYLLCHGNPSSNSPLKTGLPTFLCICLWDQENTTTSFFFSLPVEAHFMCFSIHIELFISATFVSEEWINEVKWAEWVVWRMVWNLLERLFNSCLRQQRKLWKLSCIFIEMVSAAFRSVHDSSILQMCMWVSLWFFFCQAAMQPSVMLKLCWPQEDCFRTQGTDL